MGVDVAAEQRDERVNVQHRWFAPPAEGGVVVGGPTHPVVEDRAASTCATR